MFAWLYLAHPEVSEVPMPLHMDQRTNSWVYGFMRSEVIFFCVCVRKCGCTFILHVNVRHTGQTPFNVIDRMQM